MKSDLFLLLNTFKLQADISYETINVGFYMKTVPERNSFYSFKMKGVGCVKYNKF